MFSFKIVWIGHLVAAVTLLMHKHLHVKKDTVSDWYTTESQVRRANFFLSRGYTHVSHGLAV